MRPKKAHLDVLVKQKGEEHTKLIGEKEAIDPNSSSSTAVGRYQHHATQSEGRPAPAFHALHRDTVVPPILERKGENKTSDGNWSPRYKNSFDSHGKKRKHKERRGQTTECQLQSRRPEETCTAEDLELLPLSRPVDHTAATYPRAPARRLSPLLPHPPSLSPSPSHSSLSYPAPPIPPRSGAYPHETSYSLSSTANLHSSEPFTPPSSPLFTLPSPPPPDVLFAPPTLSGVTPPTKDLSHGATSLMRHSKTPETP